MKPSIQKLLKIFNLEADRGYDNHAVMGGLVRMLDHWVPEARNEGIPEDLIQAIIYRIEDYARLTAKSRSETLEGLKRRIQRSNVELTNTSASQEAIETTLPHEKVEKVSNNTYTPVDPTSTQEKEVITCC